MNPETTAKRVHICRLLQSHGFSVDEDTAHKDIFISKKGGKKFSYIPRDREGSVNDGRKFLADTPENFIKKCDNILSGIYPPTHKQTAFIIKLCEITGTEIDPEWFFDHSKCNSAINNLKEKKDKMKMEEYFSKQTQEIYPSFNPPKISELTKERTSLQGKWKNLSVRLPYYGYVYVIKGIDRCKIGMSINPERRTKEIISQSGIGKDAKVAFFGPLVDRRLCEAKCHKELDDSRVEGTEWFTETYENCCQAVEKVIEDYSLAATEEKLESLKKEMAEFYKKDLKVTYG